MQGGQFAPAGAGVGRQDHQAAVAGVDGVGETVHLRAGQPDHAWRGWLGCVFDEGRGPSSATARGGEGGAVQVAVVDGGVADGAKQR